MARIIGIDYGTKRIGVATTDPLQIIACPLETVATPQIYEFLTNYFFTEEIESIIVGEPKKLDDTEADIMPQVRTFVKKLKQLFPDISVHMQDERYTSREAQRVLLNSGIKKMKRRDKTLIDKISASIILEEWMKASGKWTF
jgi:putative holliday junction resolvase